MTMAPFRSLNGHRLIIIVSTGVYNFKLSVPKHGSVWVMGVTFRYFENCGHELMYSCGHVLFNCYYWQGNEHKFTYVSCR